MTPQLTDCALFGLPQAAAAIGGWMLNLLHGFAVGKAVHSLILWLLH